MRTSENLTIAANMRHLGGCCQEDLLCRRLGEGEFGWLAEVGNELKGCRDCGVAMVELSEIAARLGDEQKLKLKYRNLITVNGRAKWVVRTDRLLDVDEEQGILYVERDGQPAWVKVEEAIRVTRHRAKG